MWLLGGGGVHDDGDRRCQGVGKIACMPPRLLRLPFIMGEQFVQFLDHWHDFVRQGRSDAILVPRAHPGYFQAHAAQGASAMTGLYCRHDDETQAAYVKAFDPGRTENGNLLNKAGAYLSAHEQSE